MRFVGLVLIFWCGAALAGLFADGYSSPAPGAPARLASRLFTIHTLADACEQSPALQIIAVAPDNITLAAGDRIRRGEGAFRKVIAQDASGKFLPAIPITIDIKPSGNEVFWGLSATDYAEAIRQGSAKLVVRSLCDDAVSPGELAVTVTDDAPVTPGFCASYLDQETALRGEAWRFADIGPAAMDAATRAGVNPRVTIGDFDRDGVADTASLVRRNDGDTEVAVCLSSRPRPVHYIADPYCDDSVGTTGAGTGYYDYERAAYGETDRDGIRVSCFERAGASYRYEAGRFSRIVDSDWRCPPP